MFTLNPRIPTHVALGHEILKNGLKNGRAWFVAENENIILMEITEVLRKWRMDTTFTS